MFSCPIGTKLICSQIGKIDWFSLEDTFPQKQSVVNAV